MILSELIQHISIESIIGSNLMEVTDIQFDSRLVKLPKEFLFMIITVVILPIFIMILMGIKRIFLKTTKN